VLAGGRADAQWRAAGYLGASHTQSANVTIDQPGQDTSLTFQNVTFLARSFTSPQYYGVRVGRFVGERHRWAIEAEWIHAKVYSDTARTVHVSGRRAGMAIEAMTPMDTYVQRYDMSHGLNFALVNLARSVPLGSAGDAARFTLSARGGAGVAVPHAETTVGGSSRERYELGGAAFQVASGLDIRLVGRLSALVDYKFGFARPKITIADGVGQTTTRIHQLAFGLTLGLSG
jgi:hypothetical protein